MLGWQRWFAMNEFEVSLSHPNGHGELAGVCSDLN